MVGAGRGAAFFDLDKTLMQGSSGFQFARAVHEAGMLSRRQLAADGLANIKFRLRGATDAESEALRNRIAASLEGVRVRDMQRLGVRVLQRILPRLYPQMLTIAYGHQDAGRPVYIVTAAAEDLAQELARIMGFDGALGSHLSDVENGVYTGRATDRFLYRDAKAVAIRELAVRENYDLQASFAYSDSVSDAPMLQVVGHPVVVNPDTDLLALANDGDWEVLRLDRLGRKIAIVAAVLIGATGAAAGVVAARLIGAAKAPKPQPRLKRLLRRRAAPRP